MRKLWCFLILFFMTSLHAIEGTYNLTGWDPYLKQPYDGLVIITHVKDNIYNIKWLDKNLEEYTGTGLLYGNQISFVFVGLSVPIVQQQYVGVAVYTITNTTLTGTWVNWNQTLIGTEKLTLKQ